MTSAQHLTGVIPPVVTPRTQDRRLDLESFDRVLEHLIAGGVAGVFVLGSTGEVPFCTDAERRQLLTRAVETVHGRVPVIAGVIDTQTARVLEHIEAAQDLGVDAVVATAPFYAITHRAQIKRHFEVLADHANVPLYAYDLPVCVHVKLDPELLVDLGTSGALAGVKDSSGDDVSFRRLALQNRAAGEPLTLLTGHELVVDGAYLAGAHGCVPGLGNVDPAGYVRLHQLAASKDWAAVQAEQDRLAQLMQIAIGVRGTSGWGAGVGGFKTALVELGLIATNQVPEPFERLAGADVDMVRAELKTAGLLD